MGQISYRRRQQEEKMFMPTKGNKLNTDVLMKMVTFYSFRDREGDDDEDYLFCEKDINRGT